MSVSVLNTTASLTGKTLAKLEDSQTITGAKTFDLGASAPFIVVSGAAKVANLDADLLDGVDGASYLRSDVAATKSVGDLTFVDNVAAVFGTGGDATLKYDGTDLLLAPAVVGTGDLVITGASTEFDDNEGVTLGTGKDATLQYDGTNVVLNTAAVGTGALSLTKGQIKFPAAQNASTDVNTLDDYEEGAWTPVIGGSGGTSGQVYTFQVGKYVKVGKLVTAYFNISLSTLGTVTTAVQIQGLPFTSENTTNQRAPLVITHFSALTTAVVFMGGFLEPNSTAATVTHVPTAAATGAGVMAQADLSNNTVLIGMVTYAATA